MALGAEPSDLPSLIAAAVVSWAGLASASLGLNRAGSYTMAAAKARVEQPAVSDYDPKAPTSDSGAQG